MIVTSLGTVIGALSDGQRTNLQDLMLILGLIGVTVGMCAGVGRWLWQRFAVPTIERVVRDTVTEVVDERTAELRVNGGASIKDSIGVLLAGQAEMRQQFTDLNHRMTRMEDR